jgi:antitoxin MazE
MLRGGDMEAIIKKWGNSAAVRIPAAVLAAANLALGQTVEVRAENGQVIIEPVANWNFDIDKLLADITPENVHVPVDFDQPIGREML